MATQPTPYLGAGFAHAGLSAAGFGLPATAFAASGVPFPSPVTGLPLACRNIDPVTQEYTFDANGRAQGMTQAQQLVTLAMRTVQGSSAQYSLGQGFTDGLDIDDNYVQRKTAQVNNALAGIVNAGLIRVTSVTVQRFGQSGVYIQVAWVDLSTGVAQTSQV